MQIGDKFVGFFFAMAAAVLIASCSKGDATQPQGQHGRKGHGDDQPVPVVVAAVQRQDVPIYLDGLGTVQAFNTVTIRAQVNGQLVKVPFKEGDEVRAGDLIAQIDPRTYQATLDQAIAKKAQDAAQLESARLDLKRYRASLPDGFVTQQQVDQQTQLVAQYEAAVQGDEAAIQSDRVQLSFTGITSPIPGILGIRQVDVGNLVSSTDTGGIVVVTQIKPIAVMFTLPEQGLAAIRADAAESLTVVAVNRDDQSEVARGTLMAYDNEIDPTTGTIKLKARFPNDDRKLWPGQFINIRLLVDTRHDGLVIPAQAVQRGPDGSFVYVAKADQTVEMRPLTVAQTDGGLALIDKGLQAGEQVVVDGQYRLEPGSKIVPGPAVTPPAAATAAAGGGRHKGKKPVADASGASAESPASPPSASSTSK